MTIDTERLKTDAAYWDQRDPFGATHFDTESEFFCNHEGYYCGFGEFRHWSLPNIIERNPKRFIERPTKPAAPDWDGEGLPPVGCECEARYDTYKHEWHKARIVGHDGDVVIGRWLAGSKVGDLLEYRLQGSFRPIRTKEQREREDLGKLVLEAYLKGASGHVGGLIAITDAILSKYNLEPKP